jgi:hypothetical protein
MGGAFVAVASDATATWWNPAGLAAGPLLDLALARASAEVPEGVRPWRQSASWIAFGIPPLGISYYRFHITDIQRSDSIAAEVPVREEGGAEVPVRSLVASQLGVTFVQTLIPGVHAGTTLKYVRVTPRAAATGSSEALTRDQTEGRADLDVGVLAVADALRFGVTVRNVREPEFGGGLRLPRQVRLGMAIDPETVADLPFVIALDVDLRRYDGGSGDRRVVAFGAERWFGARRFGVRAGGRLNTVGEQERSITAGFSWAIRSGLFLEGHAVGGAATDERGWGLAGRVSF